MKLFRNRNPIQLVINSTYILFTSFEQNIDDGSACIDLFDNGSLIACLYDEDAQEFIKLMESENDTTN